MKTNFQFTLTGKDWWGPFLGFWVLFLLVYIPQATLPRWGLMEAGLNGLYFLASILFMFVTIILSSIFNIVFLRILLPKLTVNGKAFSFKGDIGKYLGMNLLGILLTIVTLTIYAPWYTRRITAYLMSETTYDGTAPEFLGKGGRLFKYFLLCLWVPLIVFCVIIALTVGLATLGGSAYGSYPGGAQLITMLLTFALVFVIMAPLCYLMYKWYVNIRWKDVTITWKTSFWPSVGLILGQLLLTIITIGIYWPAAFLKIYRYFTAKTVLSRGEAEIGRLGFEGVKGFGLLWGQTLLSIITLGIYLPWAYAKVGRWLLSATYCETTEQPA